MIDRLLALLTVLMLIGIARPALAADLPLLPYPKHVAQSGAGFRLTDRVSIVADRKDREAQAAAARLAQLLTASTGTRIRVSGRARGPASGPAIRLMRAAGLPVEGYRLTTGPDGATITAGSGAGFFYGAVTLWQLATADGGAIPGAQIEDAPRFGWRGFMLDSARHMQSPQFIRQLIDWMAAHKLNRLHWHLVDDQGWRIEIRKYPRLTRTGAWRHPATAPGAPPLPRVGGYYSQAQIRDIVAYAAARHITIVPEIEMPGHALAPIRAYPHLGTGVPIPAGVESSWGVFPWLYNVEEPTFRFLEDVLDEVMALFPSAYIHVGGDEAFKQQWQGSPRIQQRMRELGLKDEAALQSWFIKRIEAFLHARGRKLIGWDEIIDGGIAPRATVMSWRGIDGAITAARAGHDTVLAAAPTLYLDHLQGATAIEGPGRNRPIPLSEIYAFDPLPAALTPAQQRHVLGLQANLWTEHVRGDARAAYMAFPRLSAVAEIGWIGKGRDFDGFVDRLVPQLARLERFGLAPSHSAFTPMLTSTTGTRPGVAQVTLSTQVRADIRYTLDGSAPDARSPLYRAPFEAALPTRVRAAAFRGDVRLPGQLDRSVDRATLMRRDDRQLRQCATGLTLALEDDWPAQGPRANFLTAILDPCWIYDAAPLDGVREIAVEVGQVPFNFQLANGRVRQPLRTPQGPDGELVVRAGCDGPHIATLPLAPAVGNPGVTRLSARIPPTTGSRDLCFTFAWKDPALLWTIGAVELVAP